MTRIFLTRSRTPDLATLTTLRYQERIRKTLTLTAYDGEMVTKCLPRLANDKHPYYAVLVREDREL